MNRKTLSGLVALGGLASIVLTACSSSSSGTPQQPPASAAQQSGGTQNGAQQQGFGPRSAATGEIAALSGKTMQVQSTSAQTAVTYSAKTSFTIARSTTLAAVKVGSCVTATSSSSASSGQATKLTASTVRITAAANGSCDRGGFGGGAGAGQPSGFPGGATPPSGAPGGGMPGGGTPPSGAPTGNTAQRGAAGGFLGGTVTAVSGSTISVALTARPGASSTSTAGTITVTGSTTYTTTVKTTSSSVKVGQCAVVQGSTDTRGAVAATAVALSAKTDGSCATGFGGPRG